MPTKRSPRPSDPSASRGTGPSSGADAPRDETHETSAARPEAVPTVALKRILHRERKRAPQA
jgi:hypothetical protein